MLMRLGRWGGVQGVFGVGFGFGVLKAQEWGFRGWGL